MLFLLRFSAWLFWHLRSVLLFCIHCRMVILIFKDTYGHRNSLLPCISLPIMSTRWVLSSSDQSQPVRTCRHGLLHRSSALIRNFAAFESDPAFEDLAPDQRTAICVILDCKIYGPLPVVLCVQNSLCRDDLERHEKARSRIYGTSHLSKLQDSAGDILCLGFQICASSRVQRYA